MLIAFVVYNIRGNKRVFLPWAGKELHIPDHRKNTLLYAFLGVQNLGGDHYVAETLSCISPPNIRNLGPLLF